MVIDTKMGKDAEKLYKKAIKIAADKPIIVINTHYHGDHVKGNHLFTGSKKFIGNYDLSFLQENISAENMPEEFVGDAIGDLNGRRGRIRNLENRTGFQIVQAEVPLATMFGYATDLRSATQGRATFTMQFDHYEPVPQSLSEEIIGRNRPK